MTRAQRRRREVAFHEAGHMAMSYWRREFLGSYRVEIHENGISGSYVGGARAFATEHDLMLLLGGPVAALLHKGITPRYAWVNIFESDSDRIELCLQRLKGKNDRKYQCEVQARVVDALRLPEMWRAITEIARRLETAGAVTGEEAEQVFWEFQVPTFFGPAERPCI